MKTGRNIDDRIVIELEREIARRGGSMSEEIDPPAWGRASQSAGQG